MKEKHQRPLLLVTSGVLQVSMLGSTLFLFYTNNLLAGLQSNSITCWWYHYSSSSKNISKLQEEFFLLQSWEDEWNMRLNTSKCDHHLFSRKCIPADNALSLHNTTIPNKIYTKYLRVIVGDSVNLKAHTAYIVGKATSQLAFLRRNVATHFTNKKPRPISKWSVSCRNTPVLPRPAWLKSKNMTSR